MMVTTILSYRVFVKQGVLQILRLIAASFSIFTRRLAADAAENLCKIRIVIPAGALSNLCDGKICRAATNVNGSHPHTGPVPQGGTRPTQKEEKMVRVAVLPDGQLIVEKDQL